MPDSAADMTTPNDWARADLTRIYRAALAAVEPLNLTDQALRGTLPGAEAVPEALATARRIFVLGVGKAAARMMAAAEQHLAGRIAGAVAIVPAGDIQTDAAIVPLRIARFCPSAHPLPDRSSVEAANAGVAMLEGLSSDDLLIVLLSGGASALMAAPAAPISDRKSVV